MKLTQKSNLVVLMTFHALWGLALWFSISKYGLGISTDSVHLLFGGLNLAEGRGLYSFDGSFVLLWPPLYSMLLALVHLVLRSDPFVSANILQALAFIGTSFCLSILFLKIFPENFWLALAANILSDIGVVVLTSFDAVDSDYIHLFLVLASILLTGFYLESKSARILPAMFVVGMLAMLQRYLGLAAISTSVAAVFFFDNQSLFQRISRSVWMALSILPAGLWLFVTSKLIQQRAPVSFSDNFKWFSLSVLQWFFPIDSKQPFLWFYISVLWFLIAAMVLLLFHFSRQYHIFSHYAILVLVYGLLYWLALFGSASIAYFNKLSGRFLLPFYIPFITLLVLTVDLLLRILRQRGSQTLRHVTTIGLAGLLIVIGIGLLRITIPVALQSHADGTNDFNDRAWHENSALNYWLAHPPQGDYLVFSNYPDGIAFYTWHSVYASPTRYAGPYGKQEFPVSQYRSKLFSSGEDVYVIWIQPNIYPYYYQVEDLSSIAEIEPLFVSQDGGVYRLVPKENP